MFEEKQSKTDSKTTTVLLPQQNRPSPAPILQVQRQAEAERRLITHSLRPVTLQRQQVGPMFQALNLQWEADHRLDLQRKALQEQAGGLQVPAGTIETALQRQAARGAPADALGQAPASPMQWVQAAMLEVQRVQDPTSPDQTRWLSTLERERHISALRSVGHGLAQGFKADRSPAVQRYAEYGDGLATLQRQALTSGVVRTVMQQTSPAERPMLQRAIDEALQRQAEEEARDASALHLYTLQRQLADLDRQAEQPIMDRIQARRGSGAPLPMAVQRQLEVGLNHDLTGVRIHTDGEADFLSKKVNAVAFTTAQDIYFQSGKFDPNSRTGVELLAHEAMHTVQQSKGQVGKGIDPDAGLEAEARQVGAKLASQPLVSATQPARRMSHHTAPVGNRLQRKTETPSAATPISGKASPWRAKGKLRGRPPVRDEFDVPNTEIVEDEGEYHVLRDAARGLLKGQRSRAAAMLSKDGSSVQDYRFWFAKVYSYVTENEILFAEQKTYDYPSYVMQCVLYFDKLYADNLQAIKTQVEPHWKAAFDMARQMQTTSSMGIEAPDIVYALVASMLAHIRFDLPRAEAWVAQSYTRRYGAKISDFKADFFRMSGVFDNASRSMFKDMRSLLGKAPVSSSLVNVMIDHNLTGTAMRHMIGADMSQERLDTWKRAEALSAQGLIPKNPYMLKQGQLSGNVTTPGASNTAVLKRLNPATLRPDAESINPPTNKRYIQGIKGVFSSTVETLSEEVIVVELMKYQNPIQSAKTSTDERATLLLKLIKTPGGNAFFSQESRGDQLVLTVLRVSAQRGDLSLLMNMVDSATLLPILSPGSAQEAGRFLVSSRYYSALEPVNATNQIRKWIEAGDTASNIRQAALLFQALPTAKQQVVRQMLKQAHIDPTRFSR